jgi:hypothetical protein
MGARCFAAYVPPTTAARHIGATRPVRDNGTTRPDSISSPGQNERRELRDTALHTERTRSQVCMEDVGADDHSSRILVGDKAEHRGSLWKA